MKNKITVDGVEYIRMNSDMESIQKYISNNTLKVPIDSDIIMKENSIKVPLPSANTQWTFEVFNWVMDFVREFPRAYPTHCSSDDTSKYQYINISYYREK